MIPRERTWFLIACTLLLVGEVKLQGERTYDTNEWIPITPKSQQSTVSEAGEPKTANDRVLNLEAPAQKFFPNEEYEYKKRRPSSGQFLRESPPKKGFEHPRPRKLKHPSEYKFETPPPLPLKNRPQVNYYNAESLSSYGASPIKSYKEQQSYYAPTQQQKPIADSYVPVPSINPQAPAPDAPNLYEQYRLPFNASFYQSLNPSSINNDFYQAVGNNSQPTNRVQQQSQSIASPKSTAVEQEAVQLVYVPVENLKPNNPPVAYNSRANYRQIDLPKQNYIPDEAPKRNPAARQDPNAIYQQVDLPIRQDYAPSENLETNSPTKDDYKNINQQVSLSKQEYTPVEPSKPNQLFTQSYGTTYQQNNPPKQDTSQAPLTFKLTHVPGQDKPLYSSPALTGNQDFVHPHQGKLISSRDPSGGNKQTRLESIQQDFIQQALEAHKLQQQFRDDINPLKQEIFSTTEKPKQRPHQPPLAVFLESQSKAEISDVLNILRGAKSISVQDAVTPDSPQIFIGPSNLNSPDGYTKFPLPYLNNINGNRIERKIDQLPFFVAPVSYKAPPGYSKISLPSPHVGSVVVSVPVTSTTSQPILLNENQLNPFTFSSPGYSPLSSRPQQNIFDSYDTVEPDRNRYQSTLAPQITETPTVRDTYGNAFAPRQPDAYYTQQNPNQYYKDNVPLLDIYNPEIQEQKYSTQEVTRKPPSTTTKSKPNPQLPDINPLELAINEFELHQINDQFVEHNKVKHSTTRRPQTNYDNQSVSNTRSPQSRGRHSYENESTTERVQSRGRVRGRGRGSVTKTTSTTTTATPETDRYTVLEEFVAREPSRTSTESYQGSAEVKTEVPRRPTTTFSANPYLPEEHQENTRPQLEFRQSSRPQASNQFDGQIEYKTPTTKTNSFEETKEQPEFPVEKQNPENVQKYNQFYSSNAEIENIPANVYSLGQPQTYEKIELDRPRAPLTSTRLEYENVELVKAKPDSPSTEAAPTHVHRFSPEVISYENREPNQRRPTERPNYQQYEVNINDEPTVKQIFPTETYEHLSTKDSEPQKSSQRESGETAPGYLFQPNFDQTYISLQDQAVRSLLVPNLLAPSTKPNSPSTPISKEETESSTERIVELPFSTEAETSTTTRPSRTRGRTRGRPTTTDSLAAPTPRRSSSRRRPVSRTSTERIESSSEYSTRGDSIGDHREDSGRAGSNVKQRFKTRGRTNHNEISDRISTTENDIKVLKEPSDTLNDRESPQQSYPQFEHAIDEQQIITINPNFNQEPVNKEYHQVYEVPQQITTENQQLILEYDNTRLQPTPVFDQATRVISQENDRELQREVYTKAPQEEFSRYSNANIKSGGVLINNKYDSTAKTTTSRPRGRTRGRSRFATTTSTSRPHVTRISTRPTSVAPRTTTPKEQQEFYGFTRQPSYTPPTLNIQATKQVTPSNSRRDESSIQFIGEIRPKYSPRATPQPTEEVEIIDTPRPRVRSRTRAPTRQTTNNYRQSDNDFHSARGTEQVTRRSGTTAKARGRGSTHYRTPENVKRESDDEDVANQNYPANFLQKLDIATAQPTTPAFKITIDPLDEAADDQYPYPSIHRPKFVPKPDDWTNPNGLPSDDKAGLKPELATESSQVLSINSKSEKPELLKLELESAKEGLQNPEVDANRFSDNKAGISKKSESESENPQALASVQTTENNQGVLNGFTSSEGVTVMTELDKSETTSGSTTLNPDSNIVTKNKSRKRGAWKLIRNRPVDPLEASESQNYRSVLNSFDSIEKVGSYSKAGGEGTLRKYPTKELSYFPQDLSGSMNAGNIETSVTTEKVNTENIITERATETNTGKIFTTVQSVGKTEESIFDTLYDMFGMFRKSAKNSTESSLIENAITTVVSPTFPEEITEIPTTEKVEETTQIQLEGDENSNQDNSETTERIKPSEKQFEVEPWQMRAVKTSTSTEITHETEICYRGRCVKSKEKKKYK